jgi:ABC-type Na+ efflux pump permease subunit
VSLDAKGLTTRDPATGQFVDGTDASRYATVIVPTVLMVLMFMVVVMGATPLMQGVVEEKMQRIAEVLLGSVKPFELMLGKLLGMTGVSLTISGVYLCGAYWAAIKFGLRDYLDTGLIGWYLLFQVLASLMFGSLFIAIGAACTEMKETQNLVLPVMLLACLPMFLMGQVLREPHSPIVQAASFFPFATPSLMIARLATPSGLAWWEPVLGVATVLATTLFCVYAAGRIFRIGILLQGKGANVREMMRWVLRG